MNKTEKIVTLVAAVFCFLSAVFMSWMPAYMMTDFILHEVALAPLMYEEVVVGSFGLIVVLATALCVWLVLQSGVASIGRNITKDDFKSLGGGSIRGGIAAILGVVGGSSFFAMIVLSATLTEAELIANKSVNDPILIGSVIMLALAIAIGASATPTRRRKIRSYSRVRNTLA